MCFFFFFYFSETDAALADRWASKERWGVPGQGEGLGLVFFFSLMRSPLHMPLCLWKCFGMVEGEINTFSPARDDEEEDGGGQGVKRRREECVAGGDDLSRDRGRWGRGGWGGSRRSKAHQGTE